jgi:hypothetical protein
MIRFALSWPLLLLLNDVPMFVMYESPVGLSGLVCVCETCVVMLLLWLLVLYEFC